MERRILSLTVREGAATVIPFMDGAEVLQEAKEAFPDYNLVLEEYSYGWIVKTENMKVQRWLRT